MSKINESIREAKRKGYYVDKNGNVFSNQKQLALRTPKSNRKQFTIRMDGERVTIPVHKFVAYLKFSKKCFEDGIEVRHLDNNSLNNSWENIEIGTHSENQLDISSEIRKKRATYASQKIRKFTDDEVVKIKQDRANGFTYKMLCEKYNTKKGTLSYLFNQSDYGKKIG